MKDKYQNIKSKLPSYFSEKEKDEAVLLLIELAYIFVGREE